MFTDNKIILGYTTVVSSCNNNIFPYFGNSKKFELLLLLL